MEPTPAAVDVILGVAALVTIVTLARSWRSLWDDTFTAADRRLTIQVGVFVVTPLVVLLHELGHVAAALLTDTRVTGFNYGVFEGSVTIAGRITVGENWFIALAGNVVSAAVGLVMVVAGMAAGRLRRPLRYLLVVGGLLQLLFALVGYPLLSLTSSFGDWQVIYRFARTPVLSWTTAAIHAGALFALWQWWRRRGRAALFAIGAGVESEVEVLQRAVDTDPGDEAARLELARFYLQRGETRLGRGVLDGAARGGGSPRLHLARARLALFEQRWNDVVNAARAGLDALDGSESVDGSGEVGQRLWANLALALGQMQRPDRALDAFAHLAPPVANDVRVAYGRGLARLARGDAQGGAADLSAVVGALPEGHLLRVWAEARLAGRDPDPPDDSHLPAYARRSAPPPAPIAGV